MNALIQEPGTLGETLDDFYLQEVCIEIPANELTEIFPGVYRDKDGAFWVIAGM